ncbi:MAG: hypothetical protein COX57_10575 [Alphaproteobacteria bacterium CG_4_10_14_0_2_um_filter_63_37]|nr:MAG: hypothetical protein AUJ55_00375 [Proteobacteria bacterium CG1_02_64_396]PJA24026.1 MAG: hypothetical protein COX57_10575 [Alphaproteobacteria bacterium CG_4_10_14_0_2_um_filter_63_37]
MATISVNGREVIVRDGLPLIEACRQAGVELPHFCHHPDLKPAGNCRMCLVSVDRIPRPVTACSLPVSDGMVVKTSTPELENARRGVLELLLIHHPLDCPVCDQAGACRLQDYGMGMGPQRTRYHEERRRVADKDFGPLVGTDLSRCILCARCARFMDEIAESDELGIINRGDRSELVKESPGGFDSNLSGNIIDICPVGALIDRPSRFRALSYQLRGRESHCTQCSLGCRIKPGVLEGEILRVSAVQAPAINGHWMCDRGRFAHLGMNRDRVLTPKIRGRDGWRETSLEEAALHVDRGLRALDTVGLIGGGRMDVGSAWLLQQWMRQGLESGNLDCRIGRGSHEDDGEAISLGDYGLPLGLPKIEQAPAILIVGSGLSRDLPMLNDRVRRAQRAGAWVGSLSDAASETHMLAGLIGAMRSRIGSEAMAQWGEQSGHPPEGLPVEGQLLVLVTREVEAHRQGALIRRLLRSWSDRDAQLLVGYPHPAMGRTAGVLAGLLPWMGPAGRLLPRKGKGMGFAEMTRPAQEGGVEGLVLAGVDGFGDGIDPESLVAMVQSRPFTVVLASHWEPWMEQTQVVLPWATPEENGGDFVSIEGRGLRLDPVVPAKGASRLRVLNALFKAGNRKDWSLSELKNETEGLLLGIGEPIELDECAPGLGEATASALWPEVPEEIVVGLGGAAPLRSPEIRRVDVLAEAMQRGLI